MADCKPAIKQCFKEIKGLYPAWWDQHYKTQQDVIDAMNVWYKHLHHLSPETISAAFDKAVQAGDYIPNALSVLKLSKPTNDDLGLPSDQQAFRQWLRMVELPTDTRDWSKVHPAVAWCHKYLASDYFTLRQKPEKDQMAAFMEFWQEAREMAETGESFGTFLPAPDKAEKAPEKPQKAGKPKTRAEIAAPHIKAIRELIDKVHVNA